jgi:hypothetical protein
MGKFLKSARSLLKIDGNRRLFLGVFPISPKAVGKLKHAVLIKYGDPELSVPLAPFIGSQVMIGRAFTWPPVKSVIIVQIVADVWIEPGGQVCPAVIATVPAV